MNPHAMFTDMNILIMLLTGFVFSRKRKDR